MSLLIQKNCSLVKFPNGSIILIQDIQYHGSFEAFKELLSVSFKLLHLGVSSYHISHIEYFYDWNVQIFCRFYREIL